MFKKRYFCRFCRFFKISPPYSMKLSLSLKLYFYLPPCHFFCPPLPTIFSVPTYDYI